MQSQTIPKETFIIVIFSGMIRGYDSHKSNFLPLLKTARVKKRHSHITYYILHTTYYILHITYYKLQIAYYILHITCYMLHFTYYMLHIT